MPLEFSTVGVFLTQSLYGCMHLQIIIGGCLAVNWSPHSNLFPQLLLEISLYLRGFPFRTQTFHWNENAFGNWHKFNLPFNNHWLVKQILHLLPVWQTSSWEQVVMEKIREITRIIIFSVLYNRDWETFCREQNSKYFRLCESKGLSHNYSTLPLYWSSHGQYVNKWM